MGARPGGFAAERHQGTHVGPGRAEGAAPTLPAPLGASGRPWRCSGAEAPHALASLVCLSVGLVNGHNAGAHAAQGELRLEQSSPRATRFDFEQKT